MKNNEKLRKQRRVKKRIYKGKLKRAKEDWNDQNNRKKKSTVKKNKTT